MSEIGHSSEAAASHHEKPQGLLPAPPEPRLLAPPDVVVFKNVTKSFGEGAEAKVAIQDINFIIEDLPNVAPPPPPVGPSGGRNPPPPPITAGFKPHSPPPRGQPLGLSNPVQAAGPDLGLGEQKTPPSPPPNRNRKFPFRFKF